VAQHISQIIPPNSDYFATFFRFKGTGTYQASSPVIQIPASLVVTAAAYREFMVKNRLDQVVEGLLEGVDVKDIEELYRPATQIKDIIHAAPIPESIYAGIEEGCQGLGDGPTLVWPVTVPNELFPSSGEYRQRSYLMATDWKGVIEGIKIWWASLFEASAIFYRELNGQKHRNARIAVVASKSG
jgi:pyruvate,water dikinase